MHSIHTLAHRAPPATRTRVRWQPYSALASSSASSSPDSYLTPASAVASPSPSCENTNLPQQPTLPQQPNREKNKFALGLVDQTIKSLSEIWRPQDIPQVFLTSTRAILPETPSPLTSNKNRNTHLHQSPVPQLFSSVTEYKPSECLLTSRNLVPIKGFVHEVLKRSRTSASVLQTALCYLEAIRPKVPELARLERLGQGSMLEPELAERITPATEAELAAEAELASGLDLASSTTSSEDCMDTVRVTDSGSTLVSSDSITHPDHVTLKKPRSPSAPLPPLPPLPSPLLCPRRAFLASLILASKFTQDKCYSNRAWAKLSGLPPREIGRCERALGDALDWRLWVGKTPSSVPQVATAPVVPRALTKCQSESNLRFTVSESAAFLVASQKKVNSSRPISSSTGASLRRASTLPSEAFNTDRYPTPYNNNTNTAVAQWIRDGADHAMLSPDSTMATPVATEIQHVHQSPPGASTISSNSTTPSTPGLSYSPSSTESSSGDRTIQMSTFLDDTTIPFNNPIGGTASDVWPWLDSTSSSPTSHLASNLSLSTPIGNNCSHAVPINSHGIQSEFSLVSGKSVESAGPHIGHWNTMYCSLQA